MARDFPNRRVMIITANGEIESEDEDEMPTEPGEEVELPDTRELLVVRGMLSVYIQPDDKIQRENIFHTAVP